MRSSIKNDVTRAYQQERRQIIGNLLAASMAPPVLPGHLQMNRNGNQVTQDFSSDIPLLSARRTFLAGAAGAPALAALAALSETGADSTAHSPDDASGGRTAKAKRVISLFRTGTPSQLDLFDYKPTLNGLRSTELPDSIRQGQRLTGMTSSQSSFPDSLSFSSVSMEKVVHGSVN